MTGLPKFGFDIFRRASSQLRAQGLNIKCPTEIDHGETDENRGQYPYTKYARASLKLLLDCDAIILMSGWETSRGCLTELYVATAMEMPIYFYNPLTEVLSTNAGRLHE